MAKKLRRGRIRVGVRERMGGRGRKGKRGRWWPPEGYGGPWMIEPWRERRKDKERVRGEK